MTTAEHLTVPLTEELHELLVSRDSTMTNTLSLSLLLAAWVEAGRPEPVRPIQVGDTVHLVGGWYPQTACMEVTAVGRKNALAVPSDGAEHTYLLYRLAHGPRPEGDDLAQTEGE